MSHNLRCAHGSNNASDLYPVIRSSDVALYKKLVALCAPGVISDPLAVVAAENATPQVRSVPNSWRVGWPGRGS